MKVLLWLYRVALLAYPFAFRRRFAAEMEEAFRQGLELQRRRRGRLLGALYAFLLAAAHALADGAARRLSRFRDPRQSLSMPRGGFVDDLTQDLRFVFRSLTRRPGWTVVVVCLLALGIGFNTAIFSAVHSVLMAPLPYPEADRIVLVEHVQKGSRSEQVAFRDFQDIGEQSGLFESSAAMFWYAGTLTGRSPAARLQGFRVTPGFFEVLGVSPLRGRAFVPEDAEDPGAVILSHGVWRGRFGGDESIVGGAITLDGAPRTVVGILPEGFDLSYPRGGNQVWVPLSPDFDLASNRAVYAFYGFARLREGVRRNNMQERLGQIGRRLESAHPETNDGRRFIARPLQEAVAGEVGPALWMLFAAVGFLLLLACANVANLLLARAEARRGELAVRSALGAGRWRLIRQVLTESLVLAAAGGVLVMAAAFGTLELLRGLAPADFPRADEIGLHPLMLGYAVAVALATGVLFGLLPAWRAGRSQAGRALGESDGRTSGRSRLRDALVAGELTLALVLLIGTGLLLSSLGQLMGQDPGFQSEGLLTFKVSLAPHAYRDASSAVRFQREAARRLESLPGVERVSFVSSLPMSGHNTGSSLTIEGRPEVPISEQPSASWQAAAPGYFEVMGIPLLEGRRFEARDPESERHVVIINQALAKEHFPQGALAERIELGIPSGDWHEIVGVVGNVRHLSLDAEPRPRAYDLYGQHWSRTFFVAVRSLSDPASLTGTVRAALAELDPDVPVYDLRTMEERLAATLAGQRFIVLLLACFAGLAVVLACVGVYGVLAYAVAQRRLEIGIRLALGAKPLGVLGLVVRKGLSLAVAGLSCGLAAAWLLTRFLQNFLFAVSPTDPLTLAAATVLLLLVSLAASVIPALRAARVDPQSTLRIGQ